jgi:hypothetical protein
MRRKKEAVLSFECCDDGLPKVVRDYRARYRNISQVLVSWFSVKWKLSHAG